MAVSEYKKRQIYQVGQLKPYVLILPVDTTLIDYSIDNGECRVKAIRCTNVYKIEGLGANYSSSETLEGRFKFSNTLTVNVPETNGNTHFSEIAQILKGNYYTIFETNNGDFFMESVDYPVEITYSYSFTNNSVSANVCALSFNSYSNIPTMSIAREKVPAATQTIIENDCKYIVGRVKRLRMCNYKNVLVSQNRNGFFDELSVNGNQSFDDIDFDKSSFSFTETYDENVFKQTITFTIPLSEYKYYWHYNLIEFTNNRYVCIIDTECGNTIISGFDFGFTPTYTIASAEASTSMDTITITLKHIGDCISASNTEGNVIINDDKLIMLSPVNEYTDANGNVHSTTVCIDETTGVRTLFEEMTSTGGHTRKYHCLEGYENIYSNLNIVGTYNADDEIGYPIKFNSSECALNHGCQLFQTPPSIVNFTSLGESHTYNIKSECDWHLEGVPSWLTIQPNEGTANNTVSVTMTTAAAPTEEGQTAIVKIVSSDGTYGTFNVNYGNISSWISPTEFSITAQAQTVACNILDSNKYNPVTIISNSIGLVRWYRDGATIKMEVSENNDYNQRVITAVAQNKQGKTVTITITQDKLYRRLVPTDGYLCDGNNSYKKMQVYKGYTSDNCNIPTDVYEKGDLILENSPDCGGVNKLYRWYALPNEFICNGYNKYYKEVYQVSTDEGLTWENVTPLQTRTGQLIESNSIDCGYGITWELVPDEYICEKTTGYIRYQKLQKYYLGQPVDPPEYKKGEQVSSDVFFDLDECENIYKWIKLDRVMCFDENDTDITVKPLKKYTPLYAASDSPVSVMDAVAGDKVYYNPTTEKIVIVSQGESYENGTMIGKVAVPSSHHRYGSDNCCSIVGTTESGYLAFSDIIDNYGSEGVINRTFDFPEYLHNWYYYEGIDCGKWEGDPFNEDKLVYPDPYGNSCDRVVFKSFWDGFYTDTENDSVFMWNNITYNDNWESLSTICDSDNVGCYGCAEYCYKFKTEGTTNGNWYFPSAYEILYLYAKMNTFSGLSLSTTYYSSTKRDMSHSVRFNYTGLSSGRGSLDSISDSTSSGARVIPFAKLYQK